MYLWKTLYIWIAQSKQYKTQLNSVSVKCSPPELSWFCLVSSVFSGSHFLCLSQLYLSCLSLHYVSVSPAPWSMLGFFSLWTSSSLSPVHLYTEVPVTNKGTQVQLCKNVLVLCSWKTLRKKIEITYFLRIATINGILPYVQDV